MATNLTKPTIAERKAKKLEELQKLKKEILELENKEAARIGKIYLETELANISISDDELRKEFEAIASKFRNEKKTNTPSSVETKKSAA